MMTLFGYWRSSASYRVRIALALKGIEVRHETVNLRDGHQKDAAHMSRNPQGFVPVLVLEDGTQLTQSLAILEYLEAVYPQPALVPEDPVIRAKLKAGCLAIATDIHPIQNLSVLKYIRAEHGQDDDGVQQWAQLWISNGFAALETMAQGYETDYFMTHVPSLFECCLIPQIYNARRFGVDMKQFPKLAAIDALCAEHPAFIQALPEHQADAPQSKA